MKKNIFSLVFAVLTLLLTGTACQKEFDTVLNTQVSTDTDISAYLPHIEYGAVTLGTFNLLYGAYSESDEYKWAVRKEALAQAIVANDFDIAGFQEVDRTIRQQLPALVSAALPQGSVRNYQYWFTNRDRQDADSEASLNAVGEGLGLMYDANKYSISDQHFFWLTDKDPDIMNVGWDEKNYHRIACCCVLSQKDDPSKAIFVMVTHMPLAANARREAASLINNRAALYNTGNLPAFLVGDMNAAPDDAATTAFKTKWLDAYEKVPASAKAGGMMTFHSKKAITETTDPSTRIDYVFYQNVDKLNSYKVDYNRYNGYYPSDHCAVSVTFDIPVPASHDESNPWLVSSIDDWNKMATSINSGSGEYKANECYKLTADLAFGAGFVRIQAFNGILDGDGHKMSGITGEATAADFGGIINVLGENGVVKDLQVEATLSSAFMNLGGVVGKDTPGSLIDGVSFKGNLSGTGSVSRIGGIIGTSYSVVVNCGCLGGRIEAGTATKSENLGGIAGRIEQNSAVMANCYSFIEKIVSSQNNFGGVTGGLGTNAYCVNVYSTCTDLSSTLATGTSFGGCIGYAKSGNIRNVYTSLEAAFAPDTNLKPWVGSDKEASDWLTTGAAISLDNMKSGAVSLPSSGASCESFLAALNAGIEDWNALENITALKGKAVLPYGVVNKPDVTLRPWVTDPESGYPVVQAKYSGGDDNVATVSIVVKDYAEANNWANETAYDTIEMNGVSLKASGKEGTANGVYNAPSYYDWRFYQAREGAVVVSVPSGFTLVSITVDYYEYKNGGLLVDPQGAQILDNEEHALSGQSAVLPVGNMGTATTGQARILSFVVKYK